MGDGGSGGMGDGEGGEEVLRAGWGFWGNGD